jgi:hypothetical protein
VDGLSIVFGNRNSIHALRVWIGRDPHQLLNRPQEGHKSSDVIDEIVIENAIPRNAVVWIKRQDHIVAAVAGDREGVDLPNEAFLDGLECRLIGLSQEGIRR